MPYATTRDDVRLYYKDQGSGPAVVLIHGWPLSSDMWEDQALALATGGYRVIAYDRRGFGRSDQPFAGYDYDTLADDLAAVIDATGVESVALIGFSMGGGEVVRYFSRHGGAKVRQAVLVSSVVPYLLKTDDNPDGVEASMFEQMKQGLREDRPKFLSGFAKGFYGVGLLSHPVSQELLDWSRQVAMQAGLKASLDCVDAFGRTDFRPDLAVIGVPVLVIHGTSDATVPIDVSGRAAARAIPGATLIEYDGAPHGLHATEKDRLSRDLLDFLAAPRRL